MHTSKTVVFLAFAASISAYNWDAELDIRDVDDYLAAQELVVRGKGGSAAQWGRRIERGSNTAGNVGTALSGVADIGNMIRGNGNGKRDLEASELFVRAAKGGARGGSAAQWGRRIERGSNAAGNVGSALSGVADVGNMLRGRDLEFEELLARAAKGGAKGGSAASWGRRIEKGSNAAGNVGTALTGIADVGNMIRGNGNGKRDLEDFLFDDSELFARGEFEFEDFEY